MPDETAQVMETLPAPSDQYVRNAEERSLSFLNPKVWQAMKVAADTFVIANAFPKELNAPKMMVAMQAGYEIGLTPIEALNSFAFINGRISLFGETAIAQVLRHGHTVEFIDCTRESATCKITRKDDGRSLSSTFTMKDAAERGLALKETYKKWPENMLKFKAFHMTAKFIVSEVFHGVPLKEELEEWKEDAVTIEPPLTKPNKNKKTVTPEGSPLESGLALLEKEPASELKVSDPVVLDDEGRTEKAKKTEPGTDLEKALLLLRTKKNMTEETLSSLGSFASRLIDDEITGRRLKPEERVFLTEYQKSGLMKGKIKT